MYNLDLYTAAVVEVVAAAATSRTPAVATRG